MAVESGPVATAASTRQRRADVVRAHMESENEQHFDATIATFTHPRYELVATAEVFDGEDAVREYYRASRARVPDQRNELIALHHTDDAVIAEFWLRGTPADGNRSFECRMAAVFVFDDSDRIVCERVYWDRQTIAAQLT
jgi:ketosteroid isomerase-like protein